MEAQRSPDGMPCFFDCIEGSEYLSLEPWQAMLSGKPSCERSQDGKLYLSFARQGLQAELEQRRMQLRSRLRNMWTDAAFYGWSMGRRAITSVQVTGRFFPARM